ncbi:hypothetical protein LC653_28930 [Nostoc sp. CHAB 5784]|uniref:hypothetical protein n=1 Tax=Nostoc mirabile TaxID=2907820 RepID=UPI001E3CF2D4|nr:hypothetical protein [Nostoc mirabile]MCC5667794.1 hypothetical protein [Nostoc mirabile CHAB5784]
MGTLVIVAFLTLMKFLNFLKPKPAQPTIDSYGQQSCGVSQEQIQSLMEWLFASLLNAGYLGKAHIIWYNSDRPDPSLEQVMKKAMHRGEPIFLYRCGGRVSSLPTGYYWRMMNEYPSMRIYQLEVKDGE